MAAWKRHWRLGSLILAAIICGTGCNALTMPFFLFQRLGGSDSNMPPKMRRLAADDKKKLVKVVVMAWSGLQSQPEFLTVDRDMTLVFCRRLQESFRTNKENVVLLPAAKVERYKDMHPNWYTDVAAVGKEFKADYVIFLQIESMSLYKPGSHNQLYQAHATIGVSLYDMAQLDAGPQLESYVTEFPNGSEQMVEGNNPLPFEQKFFEHMAKDLCRYFDGWDYGDQFDIPEP